jgi:hypothetical protein
MSYSMELTFVEDTIENDLRHKQTTQKHVAALYAMALASSWPTDWGRVNRAISARWPKGLGRVKERAWRELKERRDAAGERS